MNKQDTTYLDQLEAEAIYILREVAGQFEKPALLFSGGKDSITLVRLAEKAFRPGKFPFPLVHIDTGHNFPETITYRDNMISRIGEKLIVGYVQDSIDQGKVIEQTGKNASRNALQTVTLLDTIAENKFDACIGGARRDEEKARAKERIFSVRDEFGQWDPKRQRPELWNIYNGRIHKGENVRVFPISNWTELDVWNYIRREKIELPSIYFAHEREVITRNGQLMAAAEFLNMDHEDHIERKNVRFRTVGDMTCTAAVESDADQIDDIIEEIKFSKISERGARMDDKVSEAAMEDRKKGDIFNMDLLKFFTAGSVDDGKSTLIGRLLYDSESILADQLEALQQSNRKNDDGTIDLAILTDGLKAEREQGITIDVAYKYFQTDRRKFIIADTPGHIQYTRNMVTGASNSDLAIILVDARNGVVEQTIRHSFLVSLLELKHVVVCINKMDMVAYSEDVFNSIREAYAAIAVKLNLKEVTYIPVSALKGDNIVNKSERISWYHGKSLLDHLETIEVNEAVLSHQARMPVQWVIRPQTDELHDYRGYAGRILSGSFHVNDKITVLPSGIRSEISKIETNFTEQDEAESGMSVTLHLKDNIDIGRGDILVNTSHEPLVSQEIEADLCWMDTRPLDSSIMYLIQHNSKVTKCKIREILHKVNINTLEKIETDTFQLNDIGRIVLKTAEPLAFDLYQENKLNGGAILIDPRTNLTVGALMFRANAGY